MIYIPYAHCEVGCDVGCKAMSQPISCRLHKMSDGLLLFLRKQSKVVLLISLFSKHKQLHFLKTLFQNLFCILMPLFSLFHFVYNACCFLGIVFLFCGKLCLEVFCDKNLCTLFCNSCICSNIHRPFVCVYQKTQEAFLANTIYKFWSTYSILSNSRRIVTC